MPAELGLPFVDAGVADAMLAAQIGDRNAGLVLLQNPDDLLFRKAVALHALVLVLGQNELQTGLSPRGNVILAERSQIVSIFQYLKRAIVLPKNAVDLFFVDRLRLIVRSDDDDKQSLSSIQRENA